MCVLLCFLMLPADEASTQYLAKLFKAKYALSQLDLDRAHTYTENVLKHHGGSREALFLKLQILQQQMVTLSAKSVTRAQFLREAQDGARRFPDDFRFQYFYGRTLGSYWTWVKQNQSVFQEEHTPEFYLERAAGLLREQPGLPLEQLTEIYELKANFFQQESRFFEGALAHRKIWEMDPSNTDALVRTAMDFEEAFMLRTALEYYEEAQARLDTLPASYARVVGLNLRFVQAKLEPSPAHVNDLVSFTRSSSIEQDEIKLLEYLLRGMMQIRQYEGARLIIGQLQPLAENDVEARRVYYRHLVQLYMATGQYQLLAGLLRSRLEREDQSVFKPFLASRMVQSYLAAGDEKGLSSSLADFTELITGDLAAMLDISAFLSLAEGHAGPWTAFLENFGQKKEISALAAQGPQAYPLIAAQRLIGLYASFHRWEDAHAFLKRFFQGDKALQLDVLAADIAAMAGDDNRAFELYEKLLRQEGDRSDILNNYGFFLADRGEDLTRALALIEKAVAAEPEISAYRDSLGWAHFKLGHYDEAERHLQAALALEPGDPEKLEHLGDLYAATGRLVEARIVWGQAAEKTETRFQELLDKLDPP